MNLSQKMKVQLLNRHVSFMKPRVTVLGFDLPAWGFFFSLSLLIAVAATVALTGLAGLPKPPIIVASICGVGAMVALAFATKIVTGYEVYNFHHYLIAAMAATALALWIMGQPLLANLDLVVLGIGVGYACGRVACLRGGCCYGRPCNRGISYPAEYCDYGFPAGLVGVKLFPSQFIESLWMLLTVAVGIACLALGAQPGSTLVWFIVLYSVGRFFSDFYRLEAGFCVAGLSEAQIASIVMTCIVFGLEHVGLLPAQPLHGFAALLLFVVGVARVLSKSDAKLLFTPDHVVEIADAVRRANNNRARFSEPKSGVDSVDLPVERTSLGLQISSGIIRTERGTLVHYCFSREGAMQDSTAQALAKLISRLNGSRTQTLVKGVGGFHVIMGASENDGEAPSIRKPSPGTARYSFHTPHRISEGERSPLL